MLIFWPTKKTQDKYIIMLERRDFYFNRQIFPAPKPVRVVCH